MIDLGRLVSTERYLVYLIGICCILKTNKQKTIPGISEHLDYPFSVTDTHHIPPPTRCYNHRAGRELIYGICRPHVCLKPKNKNPNPDGVQVIRAPHGRPDGESFILERLKIIQLSAVCQLPGWRRVSIPKVTWPISSSSAWIGPLTHMLLLFLFSNFAKTMTLSSAIFVNQIPRTSAGGR